MIDAHRWARDHLSEAQYSLFFSDLQSVGWEEAMARLMARPDLLKPQKLPRFLADRKRNDFVVMLPVDRDSVVLDYGCGWGNTTFTVAPYCKKVFALDVDAQRLRFAGEHFRYRGLDNVTTIHGGNSKTLPFDDASIDIVIMNGVLEWTPVNEAGTPLEVHQRVLGEIYRVLRPGGALQISIENRYGYEYLFGRKDNHSGGLRFVTFLPRWLANIWSKIWLNRPYRTWFYSYDALKQTVATSGFVGSKIYTYFPNHVTYSHLFQIDHADSVRHVLNQIEVTQKMHFKIRMIYRFFCSFPSLFKYIAQDYMLVTRKPGGHPNDA
jgi:ubiquinone/menaquinone biosynthesis C-methylase UbiE